ncbi:sigma-70 family RNA polymerase sigma factor [Streptococcus uberis]|nr:sigma-70 family RNA polymerase sigma factor [Streptococcus uberis]MCR4258155.1 sigma-70 family RNA polymerase sigma factor [Streptococcus uberis]
MKIRKDSRKEDLHINIDAYEEEMMSYANEIIAYLMRSGVSPDQAQDVTQDVFVQILEANYSLPSSKLRAWMYRTAIRRYIDLYRRDKHYYDILKRDFFSQESLNAYDQEGYDMLDEAISQVNEKFRILLDLFYFQNFSIKEIAEITGKSQSNIKITLMRARRQLKQELQSKGYTHHEIK